MIFSSRSSRSQSTEETPPDPATSEVERKKMAEAEKRFENFIGGCACLLIIGGILIFVLVKGLLMLGSYVSIMLSQDSTSIQCDSKRIIGYHYGFENRSRTDEQIKNVTHIVFKGFKVDPDGRIRFINDQAQLSFYYMLDMIRYTKPDVKIMFSVDYRSLKNVIEIMKDSNRKEHMIELVSAWIIKHRLDGVELRYHWSSTEDEERIYANFIQELRKNFGEVEKFTRWHESYTISVVAPPGAKLQRLSNFVDYFIIATSEEKSDENEILRYCKKLSGVEQYFLKL